MKEKITVRLYQSPDAPAACDSARFHVDPAVRGWDHGTGDTLALDEKAGGRVFAVIDHVETDVHEDACGPYRLATVWTQD